MLDPRLVVLYLASSFAMDFPMTALYLLINRHGCGGASRSAGHAAHSSPRRAAWTSSYNLAGPTGPYPHLPCTRRDLHMSPALTNLYFTYTLVLWSIKPLYGSN